jgi:hypothetical protein
VTSFHKAYSRNLPGRHTPAIVRRALQKTHVCRVLPMLTCRRICCCMQGSLVTFEHNSNRVNIFYNPATNLVTRVPKRG